MSHTEEYQSKLVTAAEAVSVVKSGDIVEYGFFNGKPIACDIALAERHEELEEVQIFTAVTLPPVPEVAKHPDSFVYHDWQFSKISRIMQRDFSVAWYCPSLYHRGPIMYREQMGPMRNVAIVQVGPMDEHGYFNLGPQNSTGI